jgi:hypothetical protein
LATTGRRSVLVRRPRDHSGAARWLLTEEEIVTAERLMELWKERGEDRKAQARYQRIWRDHYADLRRSIASSIAEKGAEGALKGSATECDSVRHVDTSDHYIYRNRYSQFKI